MLLLQTDICYFTIERWLPLLLPRWVTRDVKGRGGNETTRRRMIGSITRCDLRTAQLSYSSLDLFSLLLVKTTMSPLEQFAQSSDLSLQELLQQPKEVFRFLSRYRKRHNLMQHANLFVEWIELRHERPATVDTLEAFAACCDTTVAEICSLDAADFITLSRVIVKTKVVEHTKLFGQRMLFRLEDPATVSGNTSSTLAPLSYKMEEQNSNNLLSQQVTAGAGAGNQIEYSSLGGIGTTASDKNEHSKNSDSTNRAADFSSQKMIKTDSVHDGLTSDQSASSKSCETSAMDNASCLFGLKTETLSGEERATEAVAAPARSASASEQSATPYERIAMEAASASFGFTATTHVRGSNTSESRICRGNARCISETNDKKQDVFDDASSEEQADNSHGVRKAVVVSPNEQQVRAAEPTTSNGRLEPVVNCAVSGCSSSSYRDVVAKRKIPFYVQQPRNKHQRSASFAFGVSDEQTVCEAIKREEASHQNAPSSNPITTQVKAMKTETEDDDDDDDEAASNAVPAITLGPVEKKICCTLAELDALNIKRVSKILLANLVGYTCINSKAFSSACSSLAQSGCISRGGSITQLGRSAVQQYDLAPPTSNREMHVKIRYVLRKLSNSNPKKRMPKIDEIFGALADGKAHHCIDVAKAAGYSSLNSKGYATMVSVMKELGLIHKPGQGVIQLTGICFPFGNN